MQRDAYLGILALVAACGGGGATQDAGTADAEPVAPWGSCEPDFERAYVATQFRVLGSPAGRDVDGDGDVDNVLAPIADVLSGALADRIANGATFVSIVPGLAIPPATAEAQLYMPGAFDADTDPDNNLSGGPIEINQRAFDVDCQPRGAVSVTQTGTTFAGGSTKALFLASPAGDVVLRRVVVAGEVEADGSALAYDISGAWTACGMDRITFPGLGGTDQQALRLVVGPAGLQPDIDHDGDGLERVDVDPKTLIVLRCHDGDGAVIESETCACDPRIVDGFSALAHAELVPANIVGMYR